MAAVYVDIVILLKLYLVNLNEYKAFMNNFRFY